MIRVSYCGYNSRHDKPCRFENKSGAKEYLFLITKSEAWFKVGGDVIDVKPGTMILYDINTPILYGKTTAGYTNDWICFTMDKEDMETFLSPISSHLNYPVYFHNHFTLSHYVRLLTDVFYSNNICKDLTVDALMRILLLNICNMSYENANINISHKHHTAFHHIRTDIYRMPYRQWSAEEIADSLGLSVSYFQHLYKQFFNISCQLDVINARIELAKFHLSTTNMKINQLSSMCGYANELHFNRQFKKFVGISPGKYRLLHHNP